MATTPLSYEQLGQKVKAKYPDYASHDDASVGRAVAAKYPEYQARIAPALPGPQQGASDIINTPRPSLIKQAADNFNNNTQGSQPGDGAVKGLLKDFGAGAGDVVRGGVQVVKATPDIPSDFSSFYHDMTHPHTPEEAQRRLQQRADDTVARGEQDVKAFTDNPAGVVARKAGQAGAAVLTGEAVSRVAPAVAEGAATGLNAAGRGLKAAGAGASRLAVGAPTAEAALGADAGGALARNRIVGVSRPALLRKVGRTIGPAAEARDAILRNSDAAPTDVQPLTQAPFTDISEAKTDPKTGAVRPGSMSRMNAVRRAIQEVQDPETGAPTGDLKDSRLSPAEMGGLQRNVYDMADYQTPDSDLANQYVKGVGARLKGAIDVAAPEASTATGNLHDLLGAQDHLRTVQPPPNSVSDFSPGKMAGGLYRGLRQGGGTALGAGLDVAGTGMMKIGGVLRDLTTSPVAPVPAAAPGPRRTPLLPSSTVDEGEVPPVTGREPVPGFERSATQTAPPAPAPRPRLTAEAGGEGAPGDTPVGNLHPGAPNPNTARTRITPNKPSPQAEPDWDNLDPAEVYYHGTNGDFDPTQTGLEARSTMFDHNLNDEERGVYLAPDAKSAAYWGKNVYRVHIPESMHTYDNYLTDDMNIADGSQLYTGNIPASQIYRYSGEAPKTTLPSSGRKLIADPDGTVRPEPYPLGPGADQPAGLLESATGRGAPSTRPSLLRQFRRQAGQAAVGDALDREMEVKTSQEKLAATPEGLPEQPDVTKPKVLPGDQSLIQDTTLYHGSKADLTKTGIRANISQGTKDWFQDGEAVGNPEDYKGVFLADTPGGASLYGKNVHAVTLPKRTLLRQDPLDGEPDPNAFIHPGDIPPAAVTRLPNPDDSTAKTPTRKPLLNINPKEVEEGDWSNLTPITGYHGTGVENVPSIVKKGLRPSPYGTSIALDPRTADYYSTSQGADEGHVFQVHIPPHNVINYPDSPFPDAITVRGKGQKGMVATPNAHVPSEEQSDAQSDVGVVKGLIQDARNRVSLVAPKPPTTTRLPAPDDVDGWFALVDKGEAEYDAGSHSFRYTGPIRSTRPKPKLIKE